MIKIVYIPVFLSLLLFYCAPNKPKDDTTETALPGPIGLKDHFQDHFVMGVAVGPSNLDGDERELILQHFSSITAENVMKPGPIHPEDNRYDWAPADSLARFATRHGLKMRGHTLCWHNQTGEWMLKDSEGKDASKEVALQRLKDHITAVVGRYKGTVYAWDVVNEAVGDGEGLYRDTPWYRICGEEYIAKAFEYAHEADPGALLFYNDYNTTKREKREKIVQLVKGLLDQGVPIHGIGMQGHWSVYGPDEAALRESIEAYSTLGLQIQITELDVSIYKPEGERREKRPDESDEFTPELEEKQLQAYDMFFRVFRDYKDAITAITFWNVSDRHSWLDNFPVRGRKNYPLLFDGELKPKKVYKRVVDFE